MTMVVLGMVSNSALDRLVGLLFGAWAGGDLIQIHACGYTENL